MSNNYTDCQRKKNNTQPFRRTFESMLTSLTRFSQTIIVVLDNYFTSATSHINSTKIKHKKQ
jgi:hypothetical protein